MREMDVASALTAASFIAMLFLFAFPFFDNREYTADNERDPGGFAPHGVV
jgi:hypothetical protein